jgi:glycosyltransferase involved in cell wall biosynthesis
LPELFGLPAIMTDNGVAVESIEWIASPPPLHDGPIRLIGVANLQAWHGYDRVLHGLAEYLKRPDPKRACVVEIAGEGDALPFLKQTAAALNLENHVVFHGHLSGEALSALFRRGHIGLGNIGMHRTNLAHANASPLKSREYCARGIPFVIGYVDPDLSSDFPYVFYAPDDETPLDVAALIEFYENLRAARPDFPERLRHFAETHLGWERKMQEAAQFFKNGI